MLEKLPTFLTVCVLVMIFACLKRHTRSARLTLWSVGWTLVFTHFLAQLLEPVRGQANPLLRSLDNGALNFSAVAFLVSVSSAVEHRFQRRVLLVALTIPFVTYAFLDAFNVYMRWPYALCVIAAFLAAGGFSVWVKARFSPYTASVTLVCLIACTWTLWAVFHGSFQAGAIILLSLGFALPGVFMCRNYWALTPAVFTIAGGFLCWAAVFPFLLSHNLSHGMLLPNALWDTPKLFVAFGMILAVVEDKSHAIVGMQNRAGQLQRQLERFSALSARLLSSAAPETVCPDIAAAITELTHFPAAVIHVDCADGGLRIAGASGLSEGPLLALRKQTGDWTTAQIKSLCSHARRMGNSAFVLPPVEPPTDGQPAPSATADPTSPLELLIPILSASGTCMGSIVLVAPANETLISLEELGRIESLAADLAVAVELKSLHTQLVCSEKLAAVGQLVAGVAHELNNPLTAIMGFGELISDAVTCKSTNDQLQRMMSETRRMKRITDNLLRFSRQSSAEVSAQLAPVLQQVLALCEYYTRKAKVNVEIDIPSDLPPLAINEDEIKQVLLNLFNNSCDALQESTGTKKIRIRAFESGARVVIELEDNGPGFSNLNRALDPFFTTKPVGKGTGLGLSICCGIAKRRGGELRIENVPPHGGRVTLEVPVVPASNPSMLFASAHA